MAELVLRSDEFPNVFEVRGEVDLASAPQFAEELRAIGESLDGPFIVSLEHCEYMDSTGLAVLIRLTRERPEAILVVPTDTQVRRVFEITGLAQGLGVVDTVRDALNRSALEASGPQTP